MKPRQLHLHLATFPYGGNGASASEHPDCRNWFCETMLWAKKDPRISEISSSDINDTPITMSRNRAVMEARKLGADVLVMIDSDQSPCKHKNDVGFKPFVPSSFDFLYQHYDKGPVVIGAPYCGPPPYENCYVFRWESMGVYRAGEIDETSFSIVAYSRHEAAIMRGIQDCAALPTGLIMYDLRAFELIEPCHLPKEQVLTKLVAGEINIKQAEQMLTEGWFYYEWKDGTASQKASTEDVTNTRDISLAGMAKLGYNPVFANWDSPIGHWKPYCVPGRPQRYGCEQIANSFKRAVAQDDCLADQLRHVNVLKDLPINPEQYASNGHAPVNRIAEHTNGKPKLYVHKTPQEHLEALKRVVESEFSRLHQTAVVWSNALKGIAADCDKLSVCEVGTWHGDSAKAMASTGKCTVMCVDHWQGSDLLLETAKLDPPFEHFKKNCREEIDAGTINYRTGKSTEMAQQFTIDGRMFDIVLLDADHTYEGVRDDITAWLPLVREGGVLLVHDYGSSTFPGVTQAVRDILGLDVKAYAWSMNQTGFAFYRKEPVLERVH